MMKNSTRRKLLSNILYVLIMIATVVADRITKNAAQGFFDEEGESVTAIPGVLNFTYTLNKGATAGMLADRRWVFMSISTVAIIGFLLYVFLSKKMDTLTGVSLSVLVGGGIGNMIDRVAMGAVVDFLDVTLVDFFPFNCIFNLADIFVCVGCALLVLSVILEELREKKRKKDKANDVGENIL